MLYLTEKTQKIIFREDKIPTELYDMMVQDAATTSLEHSPWHKLPKSLPSVSFFRHNEEGYKLQHGLHKLPI